MDPKLTVAIQWAKANYKRKWKKQFSESMTDHMAAKPFGISESQWKTWYFAPFGLPELNERVILLREHLANEKPSSDFVMPEKFTLKSAMRFWGVEV